MPQSDRRSRAEPHGGANLGPSRAGSPAASGAWARQGREPPRIAAGASAATATLALDAGPLRKAPSSKRLAAFLMGGALISKVLGFGREIMMAHVLGASLVADGFRGSLTAVLLPLALLQNESVPAVMIPMHREWQASGDAPRSLAALTGALTVAATAIMLIVQALGLYWIDAIVGGFSDDGRHLTLQFVRIMALGMPALVLLNSLAAGELAMGRSRLTTLRAIVLNLSILVGLLVLVGTGRVAAIAWAFAFSFNLLGAWGFWQLWREGHLDPTGIGLTQLYRAGREFLRRLRPLLALPIAEQSNGWVERVLASRLVTGTVASMDYARTITECALFLISQPLGLAVLSSGSEQDVRDQADRIARPLLAAALPASAFLVVFAPDIARLVFSRGAFNEHAVFLSSQALRGIATGLWAGTLGWILMRMLNKTGQNTRAALALGLAYGANILFNMATLRLQDVVLPGPLLLGFGDAMRGVVLLGGTALLLGCFRRVLQIVALAALPAALMLLVGLELQQTIPGLFQRLLAGGFACIGAMAFGTALLTPTAYRALAGRLRSMALGAG